MNFNRGSQRRFRQVSGARCVAAGFVLLGAIAPLRGALVYLDKNSTAAGAGVVGGSSTSWNAGTTSTSTIWGTTADGTGATSKYSVFNDGTADVVFSAGTDADGLSYSLQATGSTVIAANSITVKDGTVSITGSTSPGISLGAGGVTISNNNSASLSYSAKLSMVAPQTWDNTGTGLFTITASSTASAVSGPYLLTLAGPGAFSFEGGGNSLSGGVDINGAAVKTTQPLAFNGGNLTLNAGSLGVGSSSVSLANSYSITGNFGFTGVSAHLTMSGPGTVSNSPTVTLNDTTASGTSFGTSGSASTLTLTSNLTFNGPGNVTINDSMVQDSTSRNLTVAGSGIVTLEGSDTYTGTTSVKGGTLRVYGSLANTAGVLVGDPTNGNAFQGLLGGSGSINPSATVSIFNGSTISEDGSSSTGVLSTGPEIWASGSSAIWKLNTTAPGGTLAFPGVAGTNFDQLTIAGTLALSNSSTYTLDIKSVSGAGGIPFDGTQPYVWAIAATTGGVTGFNPVNFGLDTSNFFGTNYSPSANNTSPSGIFSLSLDGTGDNLDLSYTPVPEPTSSIAVAAVMSLGWRRRRRVG